MGVRQFVTVDGNEAAAHIAHLASEVIAIYPITPSSPMGEFADAWSSAGRKNIFGVVPEVIEMQSEGGAAGAVHGALQAGSLTTTFTASQGLLLMIPNMFKIAGELTPTVFHIAARTIATHGLSIFGDHSDVMAVRGCGWAMLAANNVQEVHDFALISHAATLRARVPFLHFFDGFRTSHEVNKIELLTNDDVSAMLDADLIRAHRERALDPDRPVLRGTSQNPDVFFQSREACNPFYLAIPGIVQATMDRFAALAGRPYRLFDYVGAPDADRVLVLMGSGVGAAEEAVAKLTASGQKIGLVKVRLYRPFDTHAFLAALPSTVRSIAVLDRTKEPGAIGEPLFLDVVAALNERRHPARDHIIGGRYGLSSKEFTPAMVKAIFEELDRSEPKTRFTIGIFDDVTRLSLPWDREWSTEAGDVVRAVFYGLGSDGTVGANKNSVKIIGENTELHAQGYFVYDSKKAGSMTVSHLRFSPRAIHSTYLVERAGFVACHQFQFLEQMDVLAAAVPGGTFLLNSPYSADEVWPYLPREVQEAVIEKGLKFHVVDAARVARDAGLGNRINTVMQTCFFALAGVLPREQAIASIKEAIQYSYGKRGESVLKKNFDAVDRSLDALREVSVPREATGDRRLVIGVKGDVPDFVQRITSMIIAGQGDLLPVSALPVDGTFPTGTAKYEKRSIAHDIPIWDPDICIQCALCPLVCPHAAIRMKVFTEADMQGAPESFASRAWSGKDLPGHRMVIQVAPDDCTGCGVCVDVCPAKSKEVAKHKAINMLPKLEHLDERKNFEFFLSIPEIDRMKVNREGVKGSQMLEPLFEYSGACAGCGETPYLKLLTQLFGDRIVVANATGCSSIYGGNLPTTPWSVNAAGRGPAWSNSLFEDNAEFGLGMRLAVDHRGEYARTLLRELAGRLGDELVTGLLDAVTETESGIAEQRGRIDRLRERLRGLDDPRARVLETLAPVLVPRSVWIIGGDGWAFDIGFGGLDHVLASGRNVNVLVLDTGVYSNTGGQASKSTPRAAVAKFAAGGKTIRRKDLGMLAVAYGSVYVGQIAVGANPAQTIRVLLEAESYPGPSLILAYSHCVAHGIEMSTSMTHQKDAIRSGFWPLYRFDPRLAGKGAHPFQLDSRKPTVPFKEFAMQEARFAMLMRSNPVEAERLFDLAQQDIDEVWHYYEQMASVERDAGQGVPREQETAS
ncbi:MAG: pyruvate:ferredoxin (flavodoxin) oxidoreductase [Planctomycetes bacterium]|nr:pyruvate:ferredoxin (flavodoxin) oxidoreductase [Planctomycetota bacterium]